MFKNLFTRSSKVEEGYDYIWGGMFDFETTDSKVDSRLMFKNIMSHAESIINSDADFTKEKVHPIFTFIKQFTDYLTLKVALSSYEHPHNTATSNDSSFFWTLFEKCQFQDYYKTVYFDSSVHNDDKKYYKHLIQEDSFVGLNNTPIIINPWNQGRIADNIVYVGTHLNAFNAQKGSPGYQNIENILYYPLGILICDGGNHSQFSQKLKGDAKTRVRQFVDISKLYEVIKFDGAKFNIQEKLNQEDKEISNQSDFYLGVLFEIGRLLLDKPEIFPQEILNSCEKIKNI
jgi:hypothetical protein